MREREEGLGGGREREKRDNVTVHFEQVHLLCEISFRLLRDQDGYVQYFLFLF